MASIIKINGVEWSVFLVEQTHEQLVDDEGEQIAYGMACCRECEIYIDEGLPPDLMRQIVTHELVHAIAASYRQNIESKSEEDICEFIAAHFDELESLRKGILKVL